MDSAPLILAIIFLLFSFQMAVLNFNRILLMLADQGSIPWDTFQSQDGLNLGGVHFCPIRRTLCIQCISLDHLQKLIAKGMLMPPPVGGSSQAQQDYRHPPSLPGGWPTWEDRRCLCGACCPQAQVSPVYSRPDPRLH